MWGLVQKGRVKTVIGHFPEEPPLPTEQEDVIDQGGLDADTAATGPPPFGDGMSYERILGQLEGGTAERPPPELGEEDDIMSVFYHGFPSEDAEGTTTTALAAPRVKKGAPPPTVKVAFDMTDYCRDTVRHYCNLVGKTVRLKKATHPFVQMVPCHQRTRKERGSWA